MFGTYEWEMRMNILFSFQFFLEYERIWWFKILWLNTLRNVILEWLFISIGTFGNNVDVNGK